MMNSFNKGVKSHLNLESLSNVTPYGCGSWITIFYWKSGLPLQTIFLCIYYFLFITHWCQKQGTLTILNQAVAGSIIVMQNRIKYFLMIMPPCCCFIIDSEYVPIWFICIQFHIFNGSKILVSRCPYRVFLFLNCWHLLHILTYSSACVKREFTVSYLAYGVFKPVSTGVFKIEVVPIYHTSAQT